MEDAVAVPDEPVVLEDPNDEDAVEVNDNDPVLAVGEVAEEAALEPVVLPEATAVGVPLAPEEAPEEAPLVADPLPLALDPEPLALAAVLLAPVALADVGVEEKGMLEVAAGSGDENDPDMPESAKLGE